MAAAESRNLLDMPFETEAGVLPSATGRGRPSTFNPLIDTAIADGLIRTATGLTKDEMDKLSHQLRAYAGKRGRAVATRRMPDGSFKWQIGGEIKRRPKNASKAVPEAPAAPNGASAHVAQPVVVTDEDFYDSALVDD